MNIIIPLAGNGSRFNNIYNVPKPLIPVNGLPMISRAIQSLGFGAKYHFVIRDNEFKQQTIDAISSVCLNPTILSIDYLTEGTASSALLLQDYINSNEELIIANCDQITNWDSASILEKLQKYDGTVVTILSSDPKHSYVKLDNTSCAVQFAEKVVISNIALTGIHYWKHGSDFVNSATKMINMKNKAANGEFYIAPTYNYMIEVGKKIGICQVTKNELAFVGTPSDLTRYLDENR